ncbi:dihydroxyacetone kinase [Anaerostipes sp. 992a]|uniref:DegV family protein n=1 Tax=Anaerostipes sp. 992a TaxID=1261637 RepID=UPI000950DDA4|nr:DegV family protein [Anaerostipes sp. 992a]OLR62024.1 dihydroxyacetone kinase [Anaerostipes sp. 992a]
MKIIVATDSASGITKEEAKKLEIPVLPVPFIINGTEYYENVNMTKETFYQLLNDDAEISTSQPSYMALTEFFNNLLKEYDAIIYIPLSSGLSGSCQTASMIAADEYDGKVWVVDNQRISVSQRQSVLDAQFLIQQGKSPQEVYDQLMNTKFDSSIYIMLDTLKYLAKGGRLTPAAAVIGNVLNLKPVLQIQGEKLDAFSKTRGYKKGTKIMLEALKNDLSGRYHEFDEKGEMYLQIAHTNCLDRALELKEKMEEEFPGYEIFLTDLPLEVSCHLGEGALGVACTRRL